MPAEILDARAAPLGVMAQTAISASEAMLEVFVIEF
jgi:hypothetical protein